jgi:hypothetical protein
LAKVRLPAASLSTRAISVFAVRRAVIGFTPDRI